MPDSHANFAVTTVATAPSTATAGTSLVVAAGKGALFPAVPFNATIWPTGAQPTSTTAEIVRVTARSTDTLTIRRAQESSAARTVVVGDQIAATITAKTLTDVEAGFSPDMALVALAPSRDQTITAAYGTVIPSDYELVMSDLDSNQVASTTSLDIQNPVLYLAQSFVATGYYTSSTVGLQLVTNGSPVDSLTIEIRADSGGNPAGSTLATANLSAASVGAAEWYGANMTATLTNGTTYWVVAHRTGANDGANFLTWNGTIADSYSSGSAVYSADSGGTWNSLAPVSDLLFRVEVAYVTEIGADAVLEIT